MSGNFSDRGLREYEYRLFSSSTLQRDIQHAGLVSANREREADIKRIPPLNEGVTREASYNMLAQKLNRQAVNPNAGTVGAWDKINKDILSYFTSGLPIYLDPASTTPEGYILNSRTQELSYCDGQNPPKVICHFTHAKDWKAIEALFPSLFNPSFAVGFGVFSNYTTLQPEKYIELMDLVLKINPRAKFERYIERDFITLYSYLKEHAASRVLIEKHDDSRTQEELISDIIKEMYAKIASYLSKEGINPVMREVMISIIQYLDSGDSDRLEEAVATYDSAWLIKTSSYLYSNEVDTTLNIIKELRKSAFLDRALKKMVSQHYLASVDQVTMEPWRQAILGHQFEEPGDEALLARRIKSHYGEEATLESVLEEKVRALAPVPLINKDIGEQRLILAAHGITDLEASAEKKVVLQHEVENQLELGSTTPEKLARLKEANRGIWPEFIETARQEILASVQQSMSQKLRSDLLNEIAREVGGMHFDDDMTTGSPDGSRESDKSAPYEFESAIVDFNGSEEAVNAMWETCRVTKEALSETLEAMLAKLTEIQEANPGVELPNIPIPEDLQLEEGGEDDKTVIEHITDKIRILQDKIAADKSKVKKTYYQPDCASLQNAINKILAYQYLARDSRLMISEEQRYVYNEMGDELTQILNNTVKQPKKDIEVINSVKTVRAEITRQLQFNNDLREQLTTFQRELGQGGLDQGTFANAIEHFIKKGGPLDAKQKELQDLMDEISECPDTEFNVVPFTEPESTADKKSWQEKVCAAVKQLNTPPLVIYKLQDVLLHQNPDREEGQEPIPREYKKVSKKKDAANAIRFTEIMETITDYANPLGMEATSRLATFFTESQSGLTATHALSMFSDRSAGGGNRVRRDNDHDSDVGSDFSHF